MTWTVNSDGDEVLALRARYVFPVSGPPLTSATVVVSGGRIVKVGEAASDVPVVDLGNVAILPSPINAHTHLELSDVDAPLGRPGIALTDWIPLVLQSRAQSSLGAEEVVRRGQRESLALGTTRLGEIAQPDWPEAAFHDTPMAATVFLELIAPTKDRVETAVRLAEEHLVRAAESSGVWLPGLSPHAPYSVHPHLLDAIVDLSARHDVPVAMHLAETREELELLHSGSGPFRTMLQRIGVWDPAVQPPGRRVLDFLRVLARSGRCLVVHGNYLDDEEMAFLAEHAERMAVVYCPRTHAWFRHAEYPLRKMRDQGVRVVLGTDSRASTPDLNLLAEMQFCTAQHPNLDPREVLEMATTEAAHALGDGDRIGSLEPGKAADLTVVALPETTADDPHDLVLRHPARVVATYREGQRCAISVE